MRDKRVLIKKCLLILTVCIGLIASGCGGGDVNIPKRGNAEFSGYKTEVFNVINIPKNCRVLCANNATVLLENSSGTQFLVLLPPIFYPLRIVPNMPELW